MLENDLRHLQRLGVDIWVSPQRARELIASGQANSFVEVEDAQSTKTTRSHRRAQRSWVQRKTTETTSTSTSRDLDAPKRRAERRPVDGRQENVAAKPTPKPFDVQLRVFLYGPVAMLIEYSQRCPDHFVKDILRALSGFEEHQLNELHFKFPLVGMSSNEAAMATLAGAQEGFQAWFEQRSPNCSSLLVVGDSAGDTATRLENKISRTISINELPLSRAGKQQLWNQIKNLNV